MNMETLRCRLSEVNISHLALRSGVSLRTIRRLKNEGERTANAATVERLASALRHFKAKV